MVTTLQRAWQRLTPANHRADRTRAELAIKYTHLKPLWSANHQVLALMADLAGKLSGDYLFALRYLRATLSRLPQEAAARLAALNGLGGGRYPDPGAALKRTLSKNYLNFSLRLGYHWRDHMEATD